MDPTRIVVVDDHPFVREGLKQLLAGQADFVLAGEAANSNDAQQTIDQCTPDIAVVDLALGSDDGVELIRWIRQKHPDIRVLVLSMQEEALYAERLLRLVGRPVGDHDHVFGRHGCRARGCDLAAGSEPIPRRRGGRSAHARRRARRSRPGPR